MPSILIQRNCSTHGLSKHRKRLDGGYRCVRCEISNLDTFRRNRKKHLVSLAGGCCIDCGYKKYLGALEFHHEDPKTKSFELTTTNMTKSWNKILKEFEKCLLLCRNCHAERHSK